MPKKKSKLKSLRAKKEKESLKAKKEKESQSKKQPEIENISDRPRRGVITYRRDDVLVGRSTYNKMET